MRSLAAQQRARIADNARHLHRQHLTESCSVWRLCNRGQDDALAPIEKRPEEASCVPCCVTTLREPVEVNIAGKVRGITDLCIYVPVTAEIRDTDELQVGGRVFDVLGVMGEDTSKSVLPVYVVRRK